MEHTGDYYKCQNKECNNIWDYMETHCPECGGQDFYTTNIQEEHETKIQELHAFELMMDMHGDLKKGVTL